MRELRQGTAEESRPAAVDPPTAERLAETFRVLGDASRVRIISTLRAGEQCVGDIARAVGMTQSAVSHHLRVLRDLRLVRSRREGRRIYYTLDDDHVLFLFAQGLDHVLHA